ncbi:MAG TPA: rhodanese-like domain-containing protein [Candidatus Dormibacteraeota bacterium]|nr:rhodanese-like domain-containing protein [Candidatus Dormibacteraeota bacterium]
MDVALMAVTTSRVLGTPAPPADVAARHFLGKLSFETDPSDVHADMAAGQPGFVVVDTRSRDAYREAHVPGAISLPHREMDAAGVAATLDPDDLVIVYCWGPHCNGAARGGARLAALGYRVKEMIGGIDGWRREGLTVATGD